MTSRSLLTLFTFLAFSACHAPAEVGDRELADLAIANTHVVSGQLVSAGQIDAAQLAALPAVGIRKLVCLRPATEDGTGWEEAEAAKLGLEFVRIPVAGPEGLTRANARMLADALADGEPALVYCKSGNRVGGLLAVKAYWLDGASPAAALDYGKAAGMTRLEPDVRAMVEQPR